MYNCVESSFSIFSNRDHQNLVAQVNPLIDRVSTNQQFLFSWNQQHEIFSDDSSKFRSIFMSLAK